MSKILIYVYGILFSKDGKIDGTRIRCFEMAKALARKGHEVYIVKSAIGEDELFDGIKVSSLNQNELRDTIKKSDVVITYLHENIFSICSLTSELKVPLVMDFYDPVLINNFFNIKDEQKAPEELLKVLKSISSADLFLCASEIQKVYYTGLFSILGKPIDQDNLISIVPFGTEIQDIQSYLTKYSNLNDKTKKQGLIRGNIIPDKNKIIIWPGEFYPWFDPNTALEAMKIIIKKDKNISLVFVGSQHFEKNDLARKEFTKIKTLAKKANLLNKSVFFVPWVAYSQRAKMYSEADIAIVTSINSIETRLSWRTRLIDLIWAGVPVICTKGDVLSDLIEERKAGITIPEKDYKLLAKEILSLINSPDKIKAMSKAMKIVNFELSWDVTIEPLNNFCKKPKLHSDKKELAIIKDLPIQLEEKLQKIQIDQDEKIRGLVKLHEKDDRELIAQIEKLRSDFDIEVKEKVNLQSEIDKTKIHIDSLHNEILIERKKVEELNKIIEIKNNELENTTSKLNNTTSKLEKSNKDLEKTNKDLENEKNMLNQARLEIKWRQETLDSIYNSKLYKYFCSPVWKVHNKMMKKKSKK